MPTPFDHLLSSQAARRRALGLIASAGVMPLSLLGCGGGDSSSSSVAEDTSTSGSTSGSTDTGSTTGTCSTIPSETAGPYPGDGTNSNSSGVANALLLSGIVRSDIRTSVDTASGTAEGVPLTVTLTLVDSGNSCAVLAGYAVYLWHATRDGEYSMYSSAVVGENYLRGVQVSDANGQVSFTTIFPGCYSGRWPHIHFEVYPSLASATSGANDVKTSQLALPASACAQVYANASGYASSATNFGNISLASDNVFGNDSGVLQLATVTGSVSAGFAATLQVGVAV
ncbi:intradiol ring-cleavage dioxygenase [Ideonella sp. 4Y16]|uniref:intradiol ring-cleavage dioxygenase n=1 Tax=Ideonella alba TaxID=2824118 RepID=UPI001B3805E2|nr:intradiol ring-cleavage dioxygenase [Ideonella alba]MBQ0942064.1 intradiol ring-cleavage dioxygenase [Ideonella alba]